MEIVVRDGEREVIIRDKRPVLDADVLADLLSAVHDHLDDDVHEAVTLPFGFTRVVAEDGPSEDDEEEAAAPDDRRRSGILAGTSTPARAARRAGSRGLPRTTRP